MQVNPPFPKEGSLDNRSVEALLREVASKALTGCVTLEPAASATSRVDDQTEGDRVERTAPGQTADAAERERQKTKLLFQRGRLVEVRGGERHRPIGELLVQNRAVAKRDLMRALKAQQRHPGRPIGQLLEGLGVLRRNELRRALCAQAQLAIGSTRAWDGGRFAFDEAETSDRTDVRLGLNELLTPLRAQAPEKPAKSPPTTATTRPGRQAKPALSTPSPQGGGRPAKARTAAESAKPAGPVVHTDFTSRPESTALLHFIQSLRNPSRPFLSQREIFCHLLDYVVSLGERAFLFEPTQQEFRVEMERRLNPRRSTSDTAASIARESDTVLRRVLESGRSVTGTLEATVGNASLVESLGMSVPRWAAAVPLQIAGRIERILYVDARYSLAAPPFEHLEIACISAARECDLLHESAATMTSRDDFQPDTADRSEANS